LKIEIEIKRRLTGSPALRTNSLS